MDWTIYVYIIIDFFVCDSSNIRYLRACEKSEFKDIKKQNQQRLLCIFISQEGFPIFISYPFKQI